MFEVQKFHSKLVTISDCFAQSKIVDICNIENSKMQTTLIVRKPTAPPLHEDGKS